VFTPSIVPTADHTVYVVEDSFGPKLGRAYRETPSDRCDRETTVRDLLTGQYNDPMRVIAFNTGEGWSRDVSCETAADVLRLADLEGHDLSGSVAEFVDFYTRPERQLTLRLV